MKVITASVITVPSGFRVNTIDDAEAPLMVEVPYPTIVLGRELLAVSAVEAKVPTATIAMLNASGFHAIMGTSSCDRPPRPRGPVVVPRLTGGRPELLGKMIVAEPLRVEMRAL